MSKKSQQLDVLSAMHNAQSEQFKAATNLAIGIIMKKVGLTEIAIEQEDLDRLVKGEQVGVSRTVSGGMLYSFHSAPVKPN